MESIDEEIGQRFFARPEAEILTSVTSGLLGMGPIFGAESRVAAGDLSALDRADKLAAYAGLLPLPTTPVS